MRVRILTALTVVGLLAGALVVTSPSAVAMEPVEQAGSVVQIGQSSRSTVGTESYTAVTQRLDNNIFAVNSDTGYLERIKTNGNAEFDIPDGVKNKEILSLSSSGRTTGDLGAVAVVTEDGLPHLWGSAAGSVVGAVDSLTSAAALGDTGEPADAEQIAVGNNLVGMLLDDGRVGVVATDGSAYPYRVLDLPETVEQIDAFGDANVNNSGLVLRLANGGVLIWKPSGSDPQGSVIVPAFPEMAGRPDGPTDQLIDVQAGYNVAVGVTEDGKVYAMNHSGSRADQSLLPLASTEGKPVEAAVIQTDAYSSNPVYMVRTDENKLYVAGTQFVITPQFRAQANGLDLTGKEIVSLTGGINNFQVILADAEPELEAGDAPTVVSSGDRDNPKVGDTLTGTPATFSPEEATLSSQWLSSDDDGETWTAIEGKDDDTPLTLTSGLVGSTIIFRTTATLGEQTLDSDSDPVGPVALPDLAVDQAAKIAGDAKVSSTLTGTPATFTGGEDEIVNEWLVRETEDGAPVETIPAAGGSSPVTLSLTSAHKDKWISFSSTAKRAADDAEVSSAVTVGPVAAAPLVTPPTVTKVTPAVTLKVTKKPTMKKAGKVAITVSGGATATGTVTVTATGKVKKGKKKAKKKTFTAHGVLKNGTATVKIKKIKKAKGKWKLSVAYVGDTAHNPAVSKTVKIKVKKK